MGETVLLLVNMRFLYAFNKGFNLQVYSVASLGLLSPLNGPFQKLYHVQCS